MKNDRNNDKESEEEDLDKETPENHVLAHLDFFWGFRAGKKSASYPEIASAVVSSRTIAWH